MCLDNILALLSAHLHNAPSDRIFAGIVSKLVVGKDKIARYENRLSDALTLIQEVLLSYPGNEGALESLIWIGDFLSDNNHRLIEMENMLNNLLSKNEHMKHGLEAAINSFKKKNPKMHGQFIQRFDRYISSGDLSGERTV